MEDKMKSKIEYLERAIIDFKNSDQLVNNYMDLIVAGARVTQQGSGLMWSEIEHILHETLLGGNMNTKDIVKVKIRVKDVYSDTHRKDLQAKLDKTVSKLENRQDSTERVSELNTAYWLNVVLNDGIEYAIEQYCVSVDDIFFNE